VTAINLTDDNQAEITISVQDGYAPLHEGTTALVRATSLSGIANRYVALTPGPNSNAKLPEGATLGTDKTTSIVDLDQLFNTFRPQTRKALGNVIKGQAQLYAGHTEGARRSYKYFEPALSTRLLVSEVVANQQTLNSFLSNAARRPARWPSAAAISPTSSPTQHDGGGHRRRERRSTRPCCCSPAPCARPTTFVNLRATLDGLDVLVAASKRRPRTCPLL
jgi:phospholipid/cholesterol/gamma-HCH transport system substrate-binding protein